MNVNVKTFIWAGVFGALIVSLLLAWNPFPHSSTVEMIRVEVGPTKSGVRKDGFAPGHRMRRPDNPSDEDKLKSILALDDPAEQKRQLDELLQELFSRNPTNAATVVLTIENEELRKQFMLRVMQTWGAEDPNAALTWAKSADFDNSYERTAAMSMACSALATTDPLRAIDLALQYKVDDTYLGLIEGLTAKWSDSDLLAASNWAKSQTDSEWRVKLIESIALEQFNKDPNAAAQFLLDEVPAGEDRDNTILALVGTMSGQNFDAALNWVKAFPQGPLQNRALEYLRTVATVNGNSRE